MCAGFPGAGYDDLLPLMPPACRVATPPCDGCDFATIDLRNASRRCLERSRKFSPRRIPPRESIGGRFQKFERARTHSVPRRCGARVIEFSALKSIVRNSGIDENYFSNTKSYEASNRKIFYHAKNGYWKI